MKDRITRRDFLKASGLGLAGLAAESLPIRPKETGFAIEWLPVYGNVLPDAFKNSKDPSQKWKLNSNPDLIQLGNLKTLTYTKTFSPEIKINPDQSISLIDSSFKNGVLTSLENDPENPSIASFVDSDGKTFVGFIDRNYFINAVNFANHGKVEILLTKRIFVEMNDSLFPKAPNFLDDESIPDHSNTFILPTNLFQSLPLDDKDNSKIKKMSSKAGFQSDGYYIRITQNGQTAYYAGSLFPEDKLERFT